MKKITFLFSLFFLLLPIYAIDASKPLNSFIYEFYDSSDGLPQNSANSFSMDSKGFMYIATQEGIVKYDGIKMNVFNTSNIIDLPSDFIKKIIVTNDDNLFFATDKGLSLYSNSGKLIENFSGDNNINHSFVTDISLTDDGGLLYGVIRGKGIFKIETRNLKKVYFFTPDNNKISTGNINAVKVFNDGSVFAATRSGLLYLKNGKFVKVHGSSDYFSSVTKDNTGNIWAAGNNGLYLISNGKVKKQLGIKEGLPFKYLSAIHADSSGTIWFGSSIDGLGNYKNGKFNDIKSSAKTKFRNIQTISEDNENNIWIGTAIDGFCIIKNGCIVDTKLQEHLILGITEDTEGNIWANSLGKGAIRISGDGKEKLINDVIGLNLYSILGDSNGNIWVSSTNRGIFISKNRKNFTDVRDYYSSGDKFPKNSSILYEDSKKNIWSNDRDRKSTVFRFFSNRMKAYKLPIENAEISDIVENSKGKIIVATKHKGIFYFNQITGHFIEIKIYSPDFFVHNMFSDSKDRLWISTHNNGILIYIDGDIVNIKLSNGLYDDTIHSIIEDSQHNFWFTTNKGIFKVNTKEIECFLSGDCRRVNPFILNESNGMPSRECNGGVRPSTTVTGDGHILVPTIKGIVKIDPLINNKIENIAPISFTWLVINNNFKNKRKVYDSTEIDLSPETKNIEIYYSSPTFSNPEEILFEQSLNSNIIVKDSKKRYASLSNLEPGKYKLRIKAYANGQKSEKYSTGEILFNIKKPIYLMDQFRNTSIFIGVLFIFTLFLMYKRGVRKREDEMLRTINEKTYKLQLINNELKEAVFKDPLTGLKNRRYLFEFEENNINSFISSKQISFQTDNRKETVFAILMLDIDHFKRVNDLYGHATGDRVLIDFSKILSESIGSDDIAMRWGGEEFLILLKNTDREKAKDIAEKIRKNVEKFPFMTENGKTIWITTSLGLTFAPFFDLAPTLLSIDNIISITDLAMYNSKNKGRDKCTVVNACKNFPSSEEQMHKMLASYQYAELNNFYIFESIVSDNNEEFDIEEGK